MVLYVIIEADYKIIMFDIALSYFEIRCFGSWVHFRHQL
jgi:hypothetical protein